MVRALPDMVEVRQLTPECLPRFLFAYSIREAWHVLVTMRELQQFLSECFRIWLLLAPSTSIGFVDKAHGDHRCVGTRHKDGCLQDLDGRGCRVYVPTSVILLLLFWVFLIPPSKWIRKSMSVIVCLSCCEISAMPRDPWLE